MCGRFARYSPIVVTPEIEVALADLALDLASALEQREPQYNIAPTQQTPVVVREDGASRAEAMRWGLIPSWAKDKKIGAHTINARVETVDSKPSFRSAFKRRRALVPASGYFEWRMEEGGKQPYFIHAPGRELLLFAGLWETWHDTEADRDLHTFTIITGAPGKVSGDIHDRQPVILPPETWAAWLDSEPGEARAILDEAPEADLEYYPVPKAVGSPKNKGPELVEPIGT